MTIRIAYQSATGRTLFASFQRRSDSFYWDNNTSLAWEAAPTVAEVKIALTEGTGRNLGTYTGTSSGNVGATTILVRIHDDTDANDAAIDCIEIVTDTNGDEVTTGSVRLGNHTDHGGTAAVLTTERIIAVSTTSGQPGIKATGNGAGDGILATGGATGDGIAAIGGSTSGSGISGNATTAGHGLQLAGSGNGYSGIVAAGEGTGHGMSLLGGGTGNGLRSTGGATSGEAIYLSTSDGHGIAGSLGGANKWMLDGANILAIKDSEDAATYLQAMMLATKGGVVVADGANSATTFATSLTETANDYWGGTGGGAVLVFLSGTVNEFQSRRISAYNGTSKFVTVESAFDAEPDALDAFIILGRIEV